MKIYFFFSSGASLCNIHIHKVTFEKMVKASSLVLLIAKLLPDQSTKKHLGISSHFL